MLLVLRAVLRIDEGWPWAFRSDEQLATTKQTTAKTKQNKRKKKTKQTTAKQNKTKKPNQKKEKRKATRT